MRDHYGGIRRLPFFGILFGLGSLRNLFDEPLGSNPAGVESATDGLIALLFLVALMMVVYYRVKNIGMNPWWSLVVLLPIANLVLLTECLACQQGYADTRKLDTAGKVVVGVCVATIGLILLAVVVSLR